VLHYPPFDSVHVRVVVVCDNVDRFIVACAAALETPWGHRPSAG
jgi:hypothetical protein